MRPSIPLVSLACLASACTGDVSMSKVNTAPVAEILSPGDDAAPFASGDTITFDGLVDDGQDPPDELATSWTSSIDGMLSEELPSSAGRVQFATNALSEGSHVVTLQVMDSSGEVGEDYVTLQVNRANAAPQVQIDAPTNGEVFEEGATIALAATVSDPDAADPPDSLAVEWVSDVHGLLCDDPPDALGAIRCDASSLSLGLHVITLSVTDGLGAVGTDQVVLEVEERDDAPLAAILLPLTNDVVLSSAIAFQAEVSDDQDRPDTLEITWESDIDDVFNWDPAEIDGGISFTGSLSPGTHQVTLTATDSQGQVAEDRIQLVVLDGGDWDTDGDTFTPNEGDCNDTDPAVNPLGTESCNGYDDDCDGSSDEDDAVDADRWYQDADGDGYGDAATPRQACTAPWGYVADRTDCDDGRAAVHPAATETCNGLDDDCDGDTDEDSAAGVRTWYRDADGDGYGDASSTDVDCYEPTGFVSDRTDCDDTRDSAFPGATEYCDGYDNDCDGSTDEPGAADMWTWYRDGDGDGYGLAGVTRSACTAPSGYVSDSTDCDDGAASVHPGATEACNTTDDDCDGDINEGLGDAYETNDTYPGTSLGSMDGDGYCVFYMGYLSGSADTQTVSGTIHTATDVDTYSFSTTDDWYDCLDESGYGITASLTGIPAGHDYVLELYGQSGSTLLASSDHGGSTSESVHFEGTYTFSSDSDDSGTYTLVVSPNASSSFGCTAYTLSVTVW